MPPPALRAQDKTSKYSTIDATYKLIGSMPPPKDGRNVATMDKFISIELQGKVINERRTSTSSQASRGLGFFLDLIFASYAEDFADITPESLTIPLSSIPAVARHPASSYRAPVGSNSVEVYDKENQRWRWNLPLGPSSEQPTATDNLGSESLTSERQVAIFFNNLVKAFAAKRPRSNAPRQWLANWSNTPMPGSTGFARKPDLVLVDNNEPYHDEVTWLSPKVIAEYTKESYQPASRIGKTMDTKAYLVLVDQPWRRFVLGVSIANCELRVHFYDHSGGAISPPFNLHTDAQHFLFIIAALAFGSRASIGFDPTIEIHPFTKRSLVARNVTSGPKGDKDPSDSVEEQKSPDPIHPTPPQPSPSVDPTPPVVEPPFRSDSEIPAIGKIRVDDTFYDIIDILFSSKGFIGRGTVCYLARLDGVYYVIKDHWVRDSDHLGGIPDPKMIYEAKMMGYVKDIDGVPKLHKAWVVEIEDGVPDTTARYREEKYRRSMQSPRTHVRLAMTPCARPLTTFRSKKELIKCIRDVLGIIQKAKERGVLHRDCSTLNTMIEDLPDGSSRGFLLDWEFSVEITQRGKYSVGGTGTLPFMSVNILRQLEDAFANSAAMTAPSIRKTASLTRIFVNRPLAIHHTYADDVKSLLYVLIWTIVMYDGPGHERDDIGHEKTFLGLWSEEAASNLAIARNAKFTFLIDTDDKTLDDAITPYCKDIAPLIHKWRALHRNAVLEGTLIEISDVTQVLNDFLASMPDELPTKIINNSLTTAQSLLSTSVSTVATLLHASKRLRDDVRSMDNPPLPNKRFKPAARNHKS